MILMCGCLSVCANIEKYFSYSFHFSWQPRTRAYDLVLREGCMSVLKEGIMQGAMTLNPYKERHMVTIIRRHPELNNRFEPCKVQFKVDIESSNSML